MTRIGKRATKEEMVLKRKDVLAFVKKRAADNAKRAAVAAKIAKEANKVAAKAAKDTISANKMLHRLQEPRLATKAAR